MDNGFDFLCGFSKEIGTFYHTNALIYVIPSLAEETVGGTGLSIRIISVL